MACYFYKNEYNKVISYISCAWLGNEIDLSDSTVDTKRPICQLTVVNGEQECYKGTVTYKDLDDFRHGTVTVDTLNTLIKVGLQGANQYQGDKIAWKTIFNKEDCQMTMIGFLRQALPVHIGTFRLDRVPDSEKLHIWTDWMEKSTSQFKILRETQDALTLRNNQLEKEFKQMETIAEDLVIQKTSTDLVLMAKFKELLNQKKRKIRRLALQLEKLKDTANIVQASVTATPSRTKSKPPTSNTQPEASLTSSSITQTPTTKKRKSNKKASTLRNTLPSSDDDRMAMSIKSDSSENDDFGNDLLLTTTRSKHRKFAHSKRLSPSKSDHGSDSTTDDEET